MSGEVSDTYAVVDKTKKINANNDGSFSQELHQDSITDVYAVVDKKRKINTEPIIMGNYDIITTDAINSTTAADNTDLYDYASAPVYGKLDSSPNETIEADKVCGPQKSYEFFFGKIYCWEHHSVFIVTCLIVLIITFFAAALAIAIAFVLIAGLHSDLTATLKNYSSSPEGSPENVKYVTNSLKPLLNQLRTDFNNFTTNAHQQVYYLNQNISDNAKYFNMEVNSTHELIRYLNGKANLLSSIVNAVERNVTEQQYKLQNLNNTVVEEIKNSSNISLTTINTLTEKISRGIQDLHTFDSCAAVSAFPIQLPSGMYNIRSGDSVMKQQYCMFSCNGISGGWTRIAYLNTTENPKSCPSELEVRSADTANPLCRRNNSDAGCSSVIYPSNGTYYSQVCGTVRIHQQETPDGFQSHNDQILRNNQSVNQNYVDGVSLTHGTNPNRIHIWTYTAAMKFGDDRDRCTICDEKKPFYIGTNFTCTAEYCMKGSCGFEDAIWTDGLLCFGNETFYRQLSELTTDNIEMRVCRDQGRNDEDILLSYLEIFVL